MKRAQSQEQLIKEMKAAGINVDGYKRNPLENQSGFAIGNKGNGKSLLIFFNPKNATINYDISKKHKQAVVSVFEKKRTVKNTVYHAPYGHINYINELKNGISVKDSEAVFKKKLQENIIECLKKYRKDSIKKNPHIPNDLKQVLKSIELAPSSINAINYLFTDKKLFFAPAIPGRDMYRFNSLFNFILTHEVSSSNLNILLGKDETHFFASVLPVRVRTVELAHKALLPKEAMNAKGIVRQGEFFYVPVRNQTVKNTLNKKPNRVVTHAEAFNSRVVYDVVKSSMRIAPRHIATDARMINGKRYVRGAVYHSGGHHKPIFLNDWHMVVKNKEVMMPESASKKRTID